MKKIRVSFLIVIFGCLALSAGTYNHEAGGISIWLPDNWKVTMNGDILEAMAPDEDAYGHLLVLKDVEDMNDAVESYAEELDGIVTDFEATVDGQEVEMNGLTFYILEGVGKVEGAKVEVGAALIGTPKTIVLMVTVNTPESNKKYEKEFDRIVRSIRAI